MRLAGSVRRLAPVKAVVKNADRNGKVVEVRGEAGSTLLEAAWEAKLDTLEGACDHAMACSTCHVYVAAKDWSRLAPPSEEELDMLDLAFEPKEHSRLACQIVLSPTIDGLEVEVPPGVSNRLADF
jgi:ferredoxin